MAVFRGVTPCEITRRHRVLEELAPRLQIRGGKPEASL
jgi:hypothetical protein